MTDDAFYAELARIMDVPHEGEAFQHYKRTRWNNRKAGRGRFSGVGVVRVFGETVHIQFRNPTLVKTCFSKQDALELVKKIFDNR